ncbi:MAG: hypothetical protein FWD19_01215, partial [Defluviitaleaceae bacterium]|nr:hypothetical protein [Defluviitaleaceae bacterium]
MKIGGKIFLIFGMTIALVIFAVFLGAGDIQQVNKEYTYLLEYPVQKYSYLQNISTDAVEMRRIATAAGYNIGNALAL